MKHTDPHALEFRFTIGRVLVLTWRAVVACRWHIALIGAPSAIVAVGVSWLASPHIEPTVPDGWQEMAYMWINVVIETAAYVAITFAAWSYMEGQRLRIRDVFRFPWRRVPSIVIAGFALQAMIWWPEALLDWPADGDHRVVIDYGILVINVLAVELLTFVLLPVLVLETSSIIPAFRRSARLAGRHPWRILAINVGFWGIYFLFFTAIGQVYLMIDPAWAHLAWSAMIAVWTVFCMALACLGAAAYRLIRSELEGPAPETFARVFD